jgi:hypothetical protein
VQTISPTKEQVAAQFQFAVLAGQYHVTGRFAALNHFLPVAGNLLHHAIEMYLKCVLARHMPLSKLKTLGHKLPKLWKSFKDIKSDPNLNSLDNAIDELDRFEKLRYPDSVVAEGMQVSFVVFKSQLGRLPDGPQPPYHLVLEEIDFLAQLLTENSGLVTNLFLPGSSEHANYYQLFENLHPVARHVLSA